MILNDDELLIHIGDDNIKLKFNALLEDSDITYETKEQVLPFSPTSFTNDSMSIRVTQKAKFTFNVFSDNRTECVNNFKNLAKILEIIKPSYEYINDQLSPKMENVTGFVNLTFKGLPIVYDKKQDKYIARNTIKLHLNNFSYNINKELGYLQVPFSELEEKNTKNYYKKNEMQLIPISYKISLEGKVLLEFDKTAHVRGLKSKDPTFGIPTTDILGNTRSTESSATNRSSTTNLNDKIKNQTKSLLGLYGTFDENGVYTPKSNLTQKEQDTMNKLVTKYKETP